jgi:hypothetical protein
LNVGERKVISRLKMEDKRNNELFFLLNKNTGEYEISESKKEQYDYCLSLRKDLSNQYIYHFYKEGKIKKTHISDDFINKKRDRVYQNGKNQKLTLVDCVVSNRDFLIGIHHVFGGKGYVKIYQSSDDIFRSDNDQLNQEGKKINPYSNNSKDFSYKIIPIEFIDDLESLRYKSPQSKGVYLAFVLSEPKKILIENWPELKHLK